MHIVFIFIFAVSTTKELKNIIKKKLTIMKKSFTIKEEIIEAIFNKKSKQLTLKFWLKMEKSKNMYECGTTYKAFNSEVENFENCTLRDLLYIDRNNFISKSKFPYPTKHINNFNL